MSLHSVSSPSGEVIAKNSLLLKMHQRAHYLGHIKLSPNDLLLMLRCFDLFMKVFFCTFLGLESTAVRTAVK